MQEARSHFPSSPCLLELMGVGKDAITATSFQLSICKVGQLALQLFLFNPTCQNKFMPTVLRKDGNAIRIYFNDHLPPHVHVFKGGGQARISLGSETERPELVQIEGMGDKDAAKALEIVSEHQLELLQRWEEIHG